MAKTTPYLQNCAKISDILAGNHEIRLTRKFVIRGILRPFSVPNNRVSRGPPVLDLLTVKRNHAVEIACTQPWFGVKLFPRQRVSIAAADCCFITITIVMHC